MVVVDVVVMVVVYVVVLVSAKMTLVPPELPS